MPEDRARAAGRAIGRAAARLWREERRRTITNLEHVSGLADPVALRRLVRLVGERLGENAVDVLRASAADLPAVRFDGLAALDAALAESRGVVVASAHQGPWEILAPALAAAGYRAGLVVRPARDPRMERALRRFREERGVRLFPRGTPTGEMLAWLRAGGVIGIVIDQRTRVRSTEAVFFGRPAPTPLGPALLAARARAPLMVGTVRRTSRPSPGLVATLVRAPGPPRRPDGRPDLVAGTRVLARLLDHQLRLDPLQWVWFHDRFDGARS